MWVDVFINSIIIAIISTIIYLRICCSVILINKSIRRDSFPLLPPAYEVRWKDRSNVSVCLCLQRGRGAPQSLVPDLIQCPFKGRSPASGPTSFQREYPTLWFQIWSHVLSKGVPQYLVPDVVPCLFKWKSPASGPRSFPGMPINEKRGLYPCKDTGMKNHMWSWLPLTLLV